MKVTTKGDDVTIKLDKPELATLVRASGIAKELARYPDECPSAKAASDALAALRAELDGETE